MEPLILKKLEDLGYATFKRGAYNLNLIGVRSATRESNKFDDRLHCVFKDDFGCWVDLCFTITTDAGLYHLNNPSRVEGTAILVSGQYRSTYRIDKHRGKYDALCQREGKVKVYRDGNRDEILDHDLDSVQEGFFGINIHRSSVKGSTKVDRYSAGCQVFSDPHEYDVFMALCKKSAQIWGNKFTYTLIEK